MVDEVYDEEIGFEKQDVPAFTRFLNLFGLMLPAHVLHEQLMDVQDKIRQEAASGSYGADRVYVTFETEEGQRNALNNLSVGLIAAVTDASGKVPLEDR
jgi:DNA-binding protein YbaB